MSAPRWTPGPWLRIDTLVYALQDSDPPWFRDGKRQKENRFDATVQGFKCPAEEKAANAALIAAAPELYEALATLLSATNPGNVDRHTSDCRCCYHEALAALAKARGELS